MQPQSVNLSVASLDASLRWYREKFGFETRFRQAYPKFGLELAFLTVGDFEIELIQHSAAQAGARNPDPPHHAKLRGITHFSFRVPDVDEMIKELKAKGVPIEWGPTSFEDANMKVVFIRDPDGNLIKFMQRLR